MVEEVLSQDVGPMLTTLTSGDSFGPQTVQDMIDDHVAVVANHKFGSKSDMTEVLVINQVRHHFFFYFFFIFLYYIVYIFLKFLFLLHAITIGHRSSPLPRFSPCHLLL